MSGTYQVQLVGAWLRQCRGIEVLKWIWRDAGERLGGLMGREATLSDGQSVIYVSTLNENEKFESTLRTR